MPALAAVSLSALLLAQGCDSPSGGQARSSGASQQPADSLSPPYGPCNAAAVSSEGMVATDAPLATRVGAEVLSSGGNAVDAAVATAFALAVVLPMAGNIGGGGFAVVRTAKGETAALDFRERAPVAATSDMYIERKGEVTDRSVTGHLASGVPGSVAGLRDLHKRYGSMDWKDLVAPAIGLAGDGFTVDSSFAASVADEADRLKKFPVSRDLFVPEGNPIPPGTIWRNPDLARTLRRIAEHGPDGFYGGETADLIVSEMERGGGLITHEDLQSYEAKWREPVEFNYRGHRIISMPPPSSGGLTMALIANILEGYDLPELGRGSPDALHVTAEAMRRSFAYRNHYLGDPDFVDIPSDVFLSKANAALLRRGISFDRATPSSEISPGFGTAYGVGDNTTHFSVVDGEGNAVALTTTLNLSYGSAVTVAGAGFLLNNEMDDFAARPGAPNAFGLVQGEANAIEPGKRMLSSMTPTIVVRDGRTVLITGASGGPRIITGVFQVISNVVDHGLDISDALCAPRIHHQHLPDSLYYESGGLTEARIAGLKNRGHRVGPRRGVIAVAASILRRDSLWTGASDPRVTGSAEGP